MTLVDYLRCLKGFIYAQSPLDHRGYYIAYDFVQKMELKIEDDEQLSQYIRNRERKGSLRELLVRLRDETRFSFVTVNEVGARYVSEFNEPLLVREFESVHTYISMDHTLTIKEQYPIDGAIRSIVHLADQRIPAQVIKLQRKPLEQDQEVVIGDVFLCGIVVVIDKTVYDRDLVKLHVCMNNRYNANRPIDMVAFNELFVCEFIALQVVLLSYRVHFTLSSGWRQKRVVPCPGDRTRHRERNGCRSLC